MTTVLFLDVARKTGVAHDGPHPGRPVTRLIRLPSPSGDAEDGRGYGGVFMAFRRDVIALAQVVRPEAIGFEAPLQIVHGKGLSSFTSQATIRMLFGLVAIVEEVAENLGIACYETHNQTIKKYLTGTGRADKAMMLAACARLGWDVGGDDNCADAAAGWALLKSLLDKSFAPSTTPLFARGLA